MQNRVSVSDGSHTVGGSEFPMVGPETAKHLCRYLAVLEQGCHVLQNGQDFNLQRQT